MIQSIAVVVVIAALLWTAIVKASEARVTFAHDLLWAARLIVARRHRRRLIYSRRKMFDEQLRPRTITYPDAFYRVTFDDLKRAIKATTYD